MEVETMSATTAADHAVQGSIKSSKADSLAELVQKLHEIFEDDNVNIEEVQHLMESYRSNRNEWDKYANFDRHRYTRNLVDSGNGKYNLMVVCWNENDASCIHDHADCHCFMKMLEGELSEIRFAWPTGSEEDSSLKETARYTLSSGEVSYINDSIGLHRVENPSHSEQAVSLHLYCPPYDECHMFDQKTGHKTPCKVTFWSKYGKRNPRGDANAVVIPKND